ncbi:hypothetical protein KP803_00670 [Vibrio sp. ZSDE26]|uniref:Uncharacterized protein n=1 Tax=Vibrio amylolyticus TaxID=2847292 RepID=A0A9X1XGX1_9VIBR|nr:hypothetical protein [Vibrio amylolyticus]MCK6261780.1 hypothetical protein [Vibrio amylolyticus]
MNSQERKERYYSIPWHDRTLSRILMVLSVNVAWGISASPLHNAMEVYLGLKQTLNLGITALIAWTIIVIGALTTSVSKTRIGAGAKRVYLALFIAMNVVSLISLIKML